MKGKQLANIEGVSFVKEILSRKCNTLAMPNIHIFSLTDVEKLLKVGQLSGIIYLGSSSDVSQ